MVFREIQAPQDYSAASRPFVFLAGSIEMGLAKRWQDIVRDALIDKASILNPRREDWNSSWKQSIDNAPFREQVEWELKGLHAADVVLFYLDPATKSPISLLELGLLAYSRTRVIVCCPDGFWRKGNVEVVCDYFRLPLVNSLGELIHVANMRLLADA